MNKPSTVMWSISVNGRFTCSVLYAPNLQPCSPSSFFHTTYSSYPQISSKYRHNLTTAHHLHYHQLDFYNPIHYVTCAPTGLLPSLLLLPRMFFPPSWIALIHPVLASNVTVSKRSFESVPDQTAAAPLLAPPYSALLFSVALTVVSSSWMGGCKCRVSQTDGGQSHRWWKNSSKEMKWNIKLSET